MLKILPAEEAVLTARPPSMFRKPGGFRKRYKPTGLLIAASSKRMWWKIHVAALNRDKSDGNISIDLMTRLAIIKFLRNEMPLQFSQVIERCRAKLKHMEGPRQPHANKAHTMRERYSQFQIAKKTVLRKVGQDLFETLREIEKQSLSKMRRSLFGDDAAASYDLFTQPAAVHRRRPRRLSQRRTLRHARQLRARLRPLPDHVRDRQRFPARAQHRGRWRALTVDAYLCAPENAQELLAGGNPEEVTPRGKAQKGILTGWVDTLERENVMEHVIASYEVVPLLGEYSPPINAQQLKNALISKTERKRVETLLHEHGGISLTNLNAAVKRIDNCKGPERAKIAGRFLWRFHALHPRPAPAGSLSRDMDSINVISNEKLRELSTINNTLYEFLLPEEQKPAEEKVTHHVIVKADIRDSTMLTRTLSDRGLNPASTSA